MVLTVLAWAYAAGAALAFLAFALPAFLDWEDYDAKGVLKCLAFALGVAVLWPVLALFMLTVSALRIYYARKDKDDED